MVSILYREVGQHENDPWMVCSPSEYSKESSPFTTVTVIREITRVWEGYEWKGCWEWGVGGDRVQLEQLLRQSRNTVIDSSWFNISIQLIGRVWILPTKWLCMCVHIWGCVHVCWWMCTHICAHACGDYTVASGIPLGCSPLNLKLIHSAMLTVQWAPEFLLPLPSQLWD